MCRIVKGESRLDANETVKGVGGGLCPHLTIECCSLGGVTYVGLRCKINSFLNLLHLHLWMICFAYMQGRLKLYAPTGGRGPTGTSPRALRPWKPEQWDYPNQLMIMPTTQAAIASVDAQPSHRSQPEITNFPMIRGWAVISIITVMTGTATTPLITAVQ